MDIIYDIFKKNTDMLELLPTGWQMSFVENLRQELFDTLGPYAMHFKIIEAKEKYSELRVYWSWHDRSYTESDMKNMDRLYDKIEDVITKYKNISRHTCVVCGRYAIHYYGMTLCDDCYEPIQKDK